MARTTRLAIIGAGPVGLEAALHAAQRGWDVAVYERSRRVAAHVRDWGHVRMFSPFGMNASERGRRSVSDAGHTVPADNELLTGHEFCDRYLVPLSGVPELRDRIRLGADVLSIGRRHCLKTERIGDPIRGQEPFQIVVSSGHEPAEADAVLDCTGVFARHNWLGSGGVPCPGERECHIEYRLPANAELAENYGGRTTLIAGSGYSAATNVLALAALIRRHPATRIIWVTRRLSEAPIRRHADDPLRERDRIATAANVLALSRAVDWRAGVSVTRIEQQAEPSDGWTVHVESTDGVRDQLRVDRVIANVGYRPDRSLYEELHVHECYATQGPMKLAARLLGETSGDCLAQPSHGADVLRNPEPNFFILGAKSYGRRNDFLLRVGLEQVEDVFRLLQGAAERTP